MSALWLSMFLFALTGAISPGPVNLIATSVGASAGFLRAMPHVLGASLSYVLIVALAGSGLNQLLIRFPQWSQVLQWMGAVYLLYLAVRIVFAPFAELTGDQAMPVPTIWQGGLVQALNPKAWLVAMSGVSLFVAADVHRWVLLALFCSISGVVCFVSVATWAMVGRMIRQWLATPAWQRAFNGGMGLALAGSVVSIWVGHG
ncbi:LysE family translocator [Leeia oryzae]|uniref:LysE family translocator n=1 Tax=Leeia oryzae TaxID=356662 RepID=UPI0003767AF3|nr:LysE family translocator [Leeia oryzae]